MSRSSAGISALRTAEALADAAAIVTRRMPAPRGLPFYGLDHPAGALDRLLASLSDLGIFRVYSHVLDLSGELGGPARWLARRHGCRVTLIDASEGVAEAAARLTGRAHLVEHVSSVVARRELLPFAPDAFTHAWGIEILGETGDRAAAFAEVSRVLRRGGWLALAERRSFPRQIEADLHAAGFVDVESVDVAALAEEDSTAARLVAERTAATLGVAPVTEERAAETRSFVALRARKPS